MKKLARISFWLLLFFVATLAHMFIWVRYEDYFPVYPEWFVFLIFHLCRPMQTYCGQETLTDLYFFFGSAINVVIMGLVVYAIYHLMVRKKHRSFI